MPSEPAWSSHWCPLTGTLGRELLLQGPKACTHRRPWRHWECPGGYSWNYMQIVLDGMSHQSVESCTSIYWKWIRNLFRTPRRGRGGCNRMEKCIVHWMTVLGGKKSWVPRRLSLFYSTLTLTFLHKMHREREEKLWQYRSIWEVACINTSSGMCLGIYDVAFEIRSH